VREEQYPQGTFSNSVKWLLECIFNDLDRLHFDDFTVAVSEKDDLLHKWTESYFSSFSELYRKKVLYSKEPTKKVVKSYIKT